MSLQGKRIFITGGSRGIGLAIALRAAADGAHVAIAAKTSEPNPKLPGTIHSAAEDIRAAGDLADKMGITAPLAGHCADIWDAASEQIGGACDHTEIQRFLETKL